MHEEIELGLCSFVGALSTSTKQRILDDLDSRYRGEPTSFTSSEVRHCDCLEDLLHYLVRRAVDRFIDNPEDPQFLATE